MTLFEGVGWFGAFIFSVTLHEAAHAWAAARGGDSTAEDEGQVSLDPWPHIQREPIGMVVLPLLTLFTLGWPIGWASAAYRVNWALSYPKRCALMAMAGPLANGLLAALALVLIKIGLQNGMFEQTSLMSVSSWVVGTNETYSGFAVILSIFLTLNTVLMVFNFLPFPPLDGASFPLLFLSRSQAESYFIFIHQPWIGWVGLILAWNLGSIVVSPAFAVIQMIIRHS